MAITTGEDKYNMQIHRFTNPANVAKATLQALRQLRLREEVMAVRDKN